MKTKVWGSTTTAVLALASLVGVAAGVAAQATRRNEYGVNLTFAIYQYDDARSKEIRDVNVLKQTVSTAEEEIGFITRNYGVEDMKARHVRSVGLREGESFSDAQTVNERELVFTVVPRSVTREGARFDVSASYGGKTLMDLKDVAVGNYETVLLKGGRGGFGVKEFVGPNGIETAPDNRALLVTITPTVINVRGLQNRPSDLSRPTDQYGAPVQLSASDVFVMPVIITRAAPKFVAGSTPKGEVKLEATITPDGRVTNVKVLDTPDAAYNVKVIEAFKQYHFKPATLNGKPTYASYRETFVFSRPGPM
jgi:TonB family protein